VFCVLDSSSVGNIRYRKTIIIPFDLSSGSGMLTLSTGWTLGGGDYGKLINPGSALQAQRARLSDWFDRGTARTWGNLAEFLYRHM
jgi:hypothetical protein